MNTYLDLVEQLCIQQGHLLGQLFRLEAEQCARARGHGMRDAHWLQWGWIHVAIILGTGGDGGELAVPLANLLVTLFAQTLGMSQVAATHKLVDELH